MSDGKVNPVLLDFPDHFETERLIIRAPHEDDAPALTEAVNLSLGHLLPWMPWAKEPYTVAQYRARLREGFAAWIKRTDLWMMLIRKEDGLMLGGSGLHRPDWDLPAFEIGYWVRVDEEGKGYVTEAVRGITDFAFGTLKAERVEIRCDSRNTRSAAVAERCDYMLEGTLRHNSRANDGTLRDTLVFSLVRDEWRVLHGGGDA